MRALIAGTIACFMTACIAGTPSIPPVPGAHGTESLREAGFQAAHVPYAAAEAESQSRAQHAVERDVWDGVEKLRTEGEF